MQGKDILEDIIIALKKRNVGDMLLYDWLSDGEHEFLGRMALFHLLRGFDDTLIILDEPETHFNDIWKRQIIDVIDSGLRNDTSEIVLSTHSSIALTDVFDTEITMLKKNPHDATVYATRPVIRSFGASPDDILRDIFGATDSVGQRASEFLDLMLIVIAKWEHVQEILAMHGTDDDIKRSKVFDQLKEFIKEQPSAYIALQTDADLADYLLRTLRAVSAYTQQHRSEVNMINMLDVLQERLGPGFYQFEFRRRLRALRKDSDAASS